MMREARRWTAVALVAFLATGCDLFTDAEPVDPPPPREVSLAVGAEHACALDVDGAAYCWGANAAGQLGTRDMDPRSTPSAVVDGHRFRAISAGGGTTCALTAADGTAYCWGLNSHGQLGDGGTGSRAQPGPVAGDTRFTAIHVGYRFACGLADTGHAYCWGANNRAQTGNAPTPSVTTPTRVAGSVTFSALTAGLVQACGLTADGTAYCWGAGEFGALGYGDILDRFQPTSVSGGLSFRSLTTGATTTCGVTAGSETYCWGLDYYGSLGTGDPHGQQLILEPTRIAVDPGFVTAGPGGENNVFTPSCGLTSTGDAACWGSNAYGVLGTTAPTQQCGPLPNGQAFTCTGVPLAVQGGLRFSTIRPAGDFTCGITTDARLFCWGNNHRGQLGTTASTQTCRVMQDEQPCSVEPLPVSGFRVP